MFFLTNEQVLRTPVPGRNFPFQHFDIFYHHKQEKEEKKCQKGQKYMGKGVYQCLGATPKCWQTPKSWVTPEKNVHSTYPMDYFIDNLLKK